MKIKQIIINLVSNAIKYTSRGEVCLEIHINEKKLFIDVKDTGAGIPADKLNEIFKPFTRLESNNTLAHGSGYGMYVVKGLIDLLGGTINILSEVGKGTLIKVEIPVGRAVSVMKNGKKRIAVYEDDPVMAKLVSDMLHNLGHSVVDEDYEVILTDMEMGDISGLDILAAAGDVPVILMTGRGDFSAEKALKTGFRGFLSKPVSMDNLREVFGEGDNLNDDFFSVKEDEEIMEIFRSSTLENFILLKQALDISDYAKVQALCHKMLPMFAQLGYPTDELRRVDAQRAVEYEGWQADVEKILTIKV